jgi:hypothetical protein
MIFTAHAVVDDARYEEMKRLYPLSGYPIALPIRSPFMFAGKPAMPAPLRGTH